MYSCKTNKYINTIGPKGEQGVTGATGATEPKGELPSPSINAAIPYEPWNLDNSTESFNMISGHIYFTQFHAPS